MKGLVNVRKFWPLLMIFCFGVLDAASTVYVYQAVGTFEYELGVLPQILYSLGDIEAVVIFKLMLTSIAAILLYYIAGNIPKLDELCKITCLGASAVGVMAALSNTQGALTGSTIWIFGIRVDIVSYLLFTLCFLFGITNLIFPGPGRRRSVTAEK
jgi:hypothetical protein